MDLTQLVSLSERPSATKRVVNRVAGWNLYRRDQVPFRRFSKRWASSPAEAITWYKNLSSKLLSYIDKRFSDELRMQLLTWEKFQFGTKGPVGPIPVGAVSNDIYTNLVEKIIKQPNPAEIEELLKSFSCLEKELSHLSKLDVARIDFKKEFMRLPSTTIRGFPYHDIGLKVDSDILSRIRGGGFIHALNFASKLDIMINMPALRFSASQEKLKIRPVFIPPVYYQYLNVGIYKPEMEHLKNLNMFAGWQGETRVNTITTMIRQAQHSGFIIVPLDFSGFDQSIHTKMRIWANRVTVSLFKPNPLFSRYNQLMQNYLSNQYFLIPKPNGGAEIIRRDNQLVSGIINTQSDGSKINLAVQCYIASKLGYAIPFKYSLALGDDVGLPVPVSLITQKGYSGVLTDIKNIVDGIGMVTHDKKSYPLPELVFLQKLWVPRLGIINHGSFTRALGSFIWPEAELMSAPTGIKSLSALLLISEISIVNEMLGFGSANYNQFILDMMSQEILSKDRLFASVMTYAKSSGLNTPTKFFRWLVGIAGGRDVLDSALHIESYDHKGLKGQLDAEDYGKVFPWLGSLLSHASTGHRNQRDVKKFFGIGNVPRK